MTPNIRYLTRCCERYSWGREFVCFYLNQPVVSSALDKEALQYLNLAAYSFRSICKPRYPEYSYAGVVHQLDTYGPDTPYSNMPPE